MLELQAILVEKAMKIILSFIFTALITFTATARNPNIIYIQADDMGYGDLSCFGQKHFKTPNIDSLAAEGMIFTEHYSGSTVCAPSRCCLLTGKHTGHSFVRGNAEIQPEGQSSMPGSTFTMAHMLKKAGYTTGVFGKWGLGAPDSDSENMTISTGSFMRKEGA
jgi:arylsulfatase A